MTLHGFYILKESFFEDMRDPYLKNNKDGNRPFYYCLKEDGYDIMWFIPMSSRVSKYEGIIASRTRSGKPCDGLHICKLPTGSKSVFLIQDIFPVTEAYIEREYTLAGCHMLLPYDADIAVIERKAKRIISLVTRGIKITPTSPDILAIMSKLR